MEHCKKGVRFGLVLMLVFFMALPGVASAFQDGAHCGKNKLGKAFIDLNTSVLTPEVLPMVLHGVGVTHQELLDQGITPDFIVSFRGMNTTIISKESSEQVQMMIADLVDKGVQMEVCSKALMLSGMTPEEVLPEIQVVENAWISSILHQNQHSGYAYVTF